MVLLFGSLKSRNPPLRSQTGPSVNLKPSASLKIFGFGGTIASIAGSFANDFDVHLARRDRDRHYTAFVKLQLRLAHPDVIGWRVRDRTVDAEDRQLDLLTGLNASIDDQPIGGVPAFDDRAATLSECARDSSPSTQISA